MQEPKGKKYASLAEGADLLDLSVREREVARHFLLGLTVRETAKALGIGAAEVRTHRDRIHARLGVRTTLGLAARASTALCRHCRAQECPWLDTEVEPTIAQPDPPSDTA